MAVLRLEEREFASKGVFGVNHGRQPEFSRVLSCGKNVILDSPAFLYAPPSIPALLATLRSDKLEKLPSGLVIGLSQLEDFRNAAQNGEPRLEKLAELPIFFDPEPELIFRSDAHDAGEFEDAMQSLASSSLRAMQRFGGLDAKKSGVYKSLKHCGDFLEASLLTQAAANATMLLPITPPVNSDNRDSVDLAIALNERAVRTLEPTPVKPFGVGYFFALERSALSTAAFRWGLEQFMFESEANRPDSGLNPHLLVIKLLKADSYKSDELLGLRDLLKTLNKIRRANAFTTIVLGAHEGGPLLLSEGFDGFAEGGGWRREGSTPYLWTGESEKIMGYCDRKSAARLFERNGYAYPCSQRCCLHRQGVHPDQIPEHDWHEDSEIHLINVRMNLVSALRAATVPERRRWLMQQFSSAVTGSKYLAWVGECP